jgi:hypothetical protein
MVIRRREPVLRKNLVGTENSNTERPAAISQVAAGEVPPEIVGFEPVVEVDLYR